MTTKAKSTKKHSASSNTSNNSPSTSVPKSTKSSGDGGKVGEKERSSSEPSAEKSAQLFYKLAEELRSRKSFEDNTFEKEKYMPTKEQLEEAMDSYPALQKMWDATVGKAIKEYEEEEDFANFMHHFFQSRRSETGDSAGFVAAVATPNGFGVFGAIPRQQFIDAAKASGLDPEKLEKYMTDMQARHKALAEARNKQEAAQVQSKREKRKQKLPKTGPPSIPESISLDNRVNVLKPRNFLEAALYFSSITMSTVEMAVVLEPDSFFAPPLLFQDASVTPQWLKSMDKELICPTVYADFKILQRKTLSVFSVGIFQTAQHFKPQNTSPNSLNSADIRALALSSKSNYLKRTIGLYAISLVDHLPPNLTTRLNEAEKNIGPMNFSSPLTPAQKLLFKNNPLLANRKLELSDLKVPSAQQLSDFWASLSSAEKSMVLRNEHASLLKGWINANKIWCLCKYCRTRKLRLSDTFELLYRCYLDDLERVALSHEGLKKESCANNSSVESASPSINPLKPKTKRHLFKSIALLAEDITNETNPILVMNLKRLGRAFEDGNEKSVSWEERHSKGKNICECCRGVKHDGISFRIEHGSSQEEDSDYSDGFDSDDLEEDEGFYEEEMEAFYEDFNFMEDEEIIQAEGELPIDPAHLSTSFPLLYQSKVSSPSKQSDEELIRTGSAIYENIASLLFQFHLVPRFLEAEAVARQRRLLEEEEEMEKMERLKAEQKAAAKQRKKEIKKKKKGSLKEETIKSDEEYLNESLVAAPVTETVISHVETEVISKVEVKVVEQEEQQVPESAANSSTNLQEELGSELLNANPIISEPIHQSLDGLNEEEEDVEAPPGLSTSTLLTGEAPPQVPSTWFDQVLSRHSLINLDSSLWRPIAPSLKPPSMMELPPGYDSAVSWSPF